MDAPALRAAVLAAIGRIAPEMDPRRIDPARPLREQVDLDSMDWLNLVSEVEQRLAIEIPPAAQQRLATLDAIVACLAARRADTAPLRCGARPAVAGPGGTCHRIGGRPVIVRPMRAGDRAAEAAFVRGLSSETRYQRFMVTMNELSEGKLDRLTQVDRRHVAPVAVDEQAPQPTLLGVARYIVDDSGTGCEFAIAIADGWHGSGLAGILMQALIDRARAGGLATMEGLVLRRNAAMLRFARQLGFEHRADAQDRDTARVLLSAPRKRRWRFRPPRGSRNSGAALRFLERL